MAAIGSMFPTYLDVVKKLDPDGTLAPVVEKLQQENPFLQDMAWVEGNLVTGHKFSSRTALPSLGWRRFNEGVMASKASTENVTEQCGSLEGFSQVDVALAELGGNAAAFRADEDTAFVQSFNNEVARSLLYESTKLTPERIHGLTPRLDYTTGNPAAAQVVKADAGATGNDQTSIWLIGWAKDKVFGIYPKGSKAGLEHKDMGEQLVDDGSGTGKKFRAFVTHWKWSFGLCVRDSRYVVRICNIDTSRLTADASTGANLLMSLQDGIASLQSMSGCSPVFYGNKLAFSWFNKQLMKAGGANILEYVERGGALVPHYLGLPFRVVDALTSSEAVVV